MCLCRGCDGCCVFCLYCEAWSCRCSRMGSVSVSSCRCCMFVSCVHHMADPGMSLNCAPTRVCRKSAHRPCFVMQVLYVCVLCASYGSSQCCVLHDLKFVNAGRGCNR